MLRTKSIPAIVVALAAVYIGRTPRASDAVTVSPAAIYLSTSNRQASFALYNGEQRPVEVDLSLAFGYPTSDSLGRVGLQLVDSVPSDEPSAAGWVRLSPRRVILQPKQTQTVQVTAFPPEALPIGEYWARMLVRSRSTSPPADIDRVPAEARTPSLRLPTETVSNTALTYRNGTVSTGVLVDHADARASDSTATLTLDLVRTGNAAFLGRAVVEVLSTRGIVVAQTSENVAVYHTLRRVFTLPVTRGNGATFRYRLSTERDDIDPSLIARGESVTGQVRFAP